MTSPYHGVYVARARGVASEVMLSSGAKIPQLGFGTYRIEPNAVDSAVRCALDNGFRHFDCAPVYRNQPEVGKALASAKKVSRDQLFITSKLWCTDQHPDRVEKACRRNLEELRVDYLDLLLLHWPICWKHPVGREYKTLDDYYPSDEGGALVDPEVTIRDTWKAMEGLVGKGLVKSIGVCNCSAQDLDFLMESTEIDPVTNQIERHPGLQQLPLHGKNTRLGIITSAYSPLGAPTRFTSPDFRGVYNHSFFTPLCELHGFSPARLLLNWALDFGSVVIVKAENEKHIIENAKAQRGAIPDTTRWMMNNFEDAVGTIRVMNPDNFLRPKGKRFFGQ